MRQDIEWSVFAAEAVLIEVLVGFHNQQHEYIGETFIVVFEELILFQPPVQRPMGRVCVMRVQLHNPGRRKENMR